MENDSINQKLDQVLTRLIKMEVGLAEVATLEQFTLFRDQIYSGLDAQIVILKRLDQERIFSNETVRRIQNHVDDQQKEINHIKKVLKST